MADTIRVTWPGGSETFSPGAVVRLGRDAGSDVHVDNDNVSRQHAELSHTGAGWVLRDVGSAQGTWVGGVRTTSVPVNGTVSVSIGQPPNGVVVELSASSAAGGQAGTVLPGGAMPGTVLPGGSPLPPPPSPTGGTPPPPPNPADRAGGPGGGAGTVVVGGSPDRPGGRLREGAVAGATVVTGDTLNLECAGRSYSFNPDQTVSLGRDEACDVVSTNPTVSRRHATIRHDGSGWVFEDAGSAGGSYIDGKRTRTRALTGSTAIWLGSAESGERVVAVASGKTRKAKRSGPGAWVAVAAVAAVVLVGVIIVGAIALVGGDDGSPPDDNRLAQATVSIVMPQSIPGEGGCTQIGYGSGSIIDAEKGLILTNAHVVKPTADGLPDLTACNGRVPLPDPTEIIIAVSPGLDRPAEPAYFATVETWDGNLDLAVIKLVRTVGGRILQTEDDFEELGLVEVETGDSDDVKTGDEVRVFGYPTDAANTNATLTTGVVSGIDGDPDLDTNRALFLVDAIIRPGNSGGLAADRSGRQIGVSTLLRAETYGALVPINFAEDLISAAQNGETYTSPYA